MKLALDHVDFAGPTRQHELASYTRWRVCMSWKDLQLRYFEQEVFLKIREKVWVP